MRRSLCCRRDSITTLVGDSLGPALYFVTESLAVLAQLQLGAFYPSRPGLRHILPAELADPSMFLQTSVRLINASEDGQTEENRELRDPRIAIGRDEVARHNAAIAFDSNRDSK